LQYATRRRRVETLILPDKSTRHTRRIRYRRIRTCSLHFDTPRLVSNVCSPLLFIHTNQSIFYRKIEPIDLQKEFFPKSSPEAVNLLKRMLPFNPAKRITVDEALADEYFSSVTVDPFYRESIPDIPIVLPMDKFECVQDFYGVYFLFSHHLLTY
jgi:serine/threonine protein kinase